MIHEDTSSQQHTINKSNNTCTIMCQSHAYNSIYGIHYSLPPVLSTDIFNHLVLTSFCTPDRFTAYKSLDAYEYFASGFGNSVGGRLLGDNFIVVGMVRTPVVYIARVFVKFSLYVLTVG